MASADSARLRAPYGVAGAQAGRRAREARTYRAPESNSKVVTFVVVGVVVLAAGCFAGYLMSENNRLREAAGTARETPPPPQTPPVAAPQPPAEEKKETAESSRKRPSAGESATTTAPTRPKPVAQPKPKQASRPKRAAFHGRAGKPDDYVRGPNGHWALAQDVWAVEVSEFKQDEKGNWDIVFRLVSVLKGEQHKDERTLTINSLNPWREFGLPPGNQGKGRKFVCFLKADGSFFTLSHSDYELVKQMGL